MARYKVVRARDGREGFVYVQTEYVPHPNGEAPATRERHTLNGEPLVSLPDGSLQDFATRLSALCGGTISSVDAGQYVAERNAVFVCGRWRCERPEHSRLFSWPAQVNVGPLTVGLMRDLL